MEEAIENAVAALAELSARYAQDVAPRIEEPASATEIAEFQTAAGEEIPASVLTLLRRTRAIVAMAIHNGYWIGGPAELARSMLRHDFPREFDAHGQSTRAIPIATDGGGNAFMVALGIGSVWRWNHETGVVRCVAHDLPEFLRRVAEDWAHDLDGDGTWNYLV